MRAVNDIQLNEKRIDLFTRINPSFLYKQRTPKVYFGVSRMELIAGFVRRGEAATEQRLFAAGAIASRYFDDPAIVTKKNTECFFGVRNMELIAGFEPATSSLPRTCSTYLAISAYEVFRHCNSSLFII